MNTRTTDYTGLFYRGLAAVAMSAPMLLVLAAGTRPDGARGVVIVNGLGAVLALVAGALLVRAAYTQGLMNKVNTAVKFNRRQGAGYSTGSYAA